MSEQLLYPPVLSRPPLPVTSLRPHGLSSVSLPSCPPAELPPPRNCSPRAGAHPHPSLCSRVLLGCWGRPLTSGLPNGGGVWICPRDSLTPD